MIDLSSIWKQETNEIRAYHLKCAEEKRKLKEFEDKLKNSKKKK